MIANPTSSDELIVRIEISKQSLEVLKNGQVVNRYPVSTALKGAGERLGSEKTPRGKHYVRAKIGTCEPVGRVFVGRRSTGEIYSEELAKNFPERDWILTRILWLCGTEPGKNRLGQVDTMRRYIYIHGCPDSVTLGKPGSRGCIRMRNADLIELFDLIWPGTPVDIN